MFRAFTPAWRLLSTNTAALVSSRTIRKQAVRFLSVTSQEAKTQPDSYTSADAQESVASGLKVMLPGQSSLNVDSISGKSSSFMYSPAALQVPMPLNERQSTRRALKWIIQASDRRADRAISRRLAVEMLAILEGNSSVLSRRDEQHKVGTINRANASVRI